MKIQMPVSPARIFRSQNVRTLINTGLQPGGEGQERGTAVSTAFRHEAQTVEIETVPDDKRRLHTGLKPGVNESVFAMCTTIDHSSRSLRRFFNVFTFHQ